MGPGISGITRELKIYVDWKDWFPKLRAGDRVATQLLLSPDITQVMPEGLDWPCLGSGVEPLLSKKVSFIYQGSESSSHPAALHRSASTSGGDVSRGERSTR